MGRGILAGLVWGSVVGFGIVTVANQVVDIVSVSPISMPSAPVANDNTPQDQTSDTAPAAEPTVEKTAEPAVDPTVKPATAPADAPKPPADPNPNVDVDQPEQSQPLTQNDTTPEVDTQEDATAPERVVTEPDEAAALTEAQAQPNVETQTAPQPIAPQPIAETPSGLSEPKETTTPTNVAGDTPVLSSPQALELVQPQTDQAPTQVDTKLPGQKPKPLGMKANTPLEAGKIDEVPAIDAPMTDAAKAEDTVSEPQMPEAQAKAKLEPQGQKVVGTKVGSFTDRTDTMKSTRLPSVAASRTGSAMTDAAPMIVADDLPAIVAYSADYSKTGTAPEMSVILVDIGALDPTSAQLSALPFPVTFAVDALAPGATERAEMYRQAGLEVLALIGLPDGATAQDVAVTINQARNVMPVSIGFLDVPSASFQANREIASQVVASAATSGHGVVSFSRGLNALMQEATRAKQPAALVFRDFDGRDQNGAAIKRFLDQAAFRAGIDEDIVLVGRAKEDTIAALVEWSLGNRAATVELVPVSFLLTQTDDVPAQ